MRLATQQINEKLVYILEGKDEAEQIRRAREVVAADSSFLPLMKLAVTKEQGIVGIPEGVPDTYKPASDIPAGIADTTLRQEFRRVKNFTQGGSTQVLKPLKRESLWIQLLEGLHYKEAEILTAVKDQTLLNTYPKLVPILEALGLEITIEKPKRKRTKKAEENGQPDS